MHANVHLVNLYLGLQAQIIKLKKIEKSVSEEFLITFVLTKLSFGQPIIEIFSLLAISTSYIGFVLGLADFLSDCMFSFAICRAHHIDIE